jgi:hypothetical protein
MKIDVEGYELHVLEGLHVGDGAVQAAVDLHFRRDGA